jgi:hypothetical protein
MKWVDFLSFSVFSFELMLSKHRDEFHYIGCCACVYKGGLSWAYKSKRCVHGCVCAHTLEDIPALYN